MGFKYESDSYKIVPQVEATLSEHLIKSSRVVGPLITDFRATYSANSILFVNFGINITYEVRKKTSYKIFLC